MRVQDGISCASLINSAIGCPLWSSRIPLTNCACLDYAPSLEKPGRTHGFQKTERILLARRAVEGREIYVRRTGGHRRIQVYYDKRGTEPWGAKERARRINEPLVMQNPFRTVHQRLTARRPVGSEPGQSRLLRRASGVPSDRRVRGMPF